MRRSYYAVFPTWAFIIGLAILIASLGACGGGSNSAVGTSVTPTPTPSVTPDPALSQKIKYVVVIVQENRTPDNLFHGLRDADIANSGVNSAGETVPLTPVPLSIGYDPFHDHSAFLTMYDGGKMDGADKVPSLCSGGTVCLVPNLTFAYVNPSDVAPYFQMAETYTFADRMFQTNQGPSFPAHQFIIAGTSAPTATSDLFASEEPMIGSTQPDNVGCTAPGNETVRLIDPAGDESATQYPCFEHPVLSDLLDGKRISWRYYTPSAGSIWTGPNAIQHLRMGRIGTTLS